MVESTHCAVSMDLAGQEFRRHVGMCGFLLYSDKNLLTGKTRTLKENHLELSPKPERGFICAVKRAGHMDY